MAFLPHCQTNLDFVLPLFCPFMNRKQAYFCIDKTFISPSHQAPPPRLKGTLILWHIWQSGYFPHKTTRVRLRLLAIFRKDEKGPCLLKIPKNQFFSENILKVKKYLSAKRFSEFVKKLKFYSNFSEACFAL